MVVSGRKDWYPHPKYTNSWEYRPSGEQGPAAGWFSYGEFFDPPIKATLPDGTECYFDVHSKAIEWVETNWRQA